MDDSEFLTAVGETEAAPAMEPAAEPGGDPAQEKTEGTDLQAELEQALAGGEKEEVQSGKADKTAGDWALEAPEDFPIPADNLDSFSDACKKAGLNREQAAAVLAWHKEQYQADNAWREQREQEIRTGWLNEIRSDTEFGGAHTRETAQYMAKGLQAVDPGGELLGLLRQTGGINHPAVIRAAARVGRLLGEHAAVPGGRRTAGDEKSLAERMWPGA